MRWLLALVVLLVPARALAGRQTVVVAPLASLGAEEKSAAAKQLQAELEKALAGVEGTTVIDAKEAQAAIAKAKRPELRVCEGDITCLVELGKLVGADLVVTGEAGGLGEIKVVYLELIDVGRSKSLRSTTLEVGDTASGGAPGAAYRLLAPDQYTGTMTLAVDASGATVYVDGKKLGKSPMKPAALSVGTHALRVTHPEYRDFVRFVDVTFHADTKIDVALHQFPVVQSEITGTGKPKSNVTYIDRPAPWYRKWWAVSAFGGIVLIAAGATAAIVADGVDADTVRPVNP
jgi:hypothetical protein